MAFVSGTPCGIICINKPQGYTSFDVIAKLRGILGIRRLGHAGTLDPLATGVLPVFVGTATKACDMLADHDKSYCAGFKLGVSTDTQDITGRVTAERDYSQVNLTALRRAAEHFSGDIMQIPPMYSAVSVGGKRLYELAREGRIIERVPRPVTVYRLDVTDYCETDGCGIMEIDCSKGTYIRTLISDIGDFIGCGGIMTSLVRTSACGFSLKDCVTIEQLQSMAEKGDNFDFLIHPIESVFDYLPKVRLCEAQERMYRNGIRLDMRRIDADDKTAAKYAVYGADGSFIGTAYVKSEDKLLRVEKNF